MFGRTKKGISAVFSVCLIFAILISGCGSKSAESAAEVSSTEQVSSTVASPEKDPNAIDISKEAKITMYLVGDAQPDAAIVYEEVNKKLKADINATVEPKYLSWADYDKKYPLIFAAGEEFDCIYTANWTHYADMATKNGFLEVNQDLLKKYMPEYYNLVPKDSWDQVKIGGKVYMIPYLNKQVVGHSLIFSRGDLREKYGLPELKTKDDFKNYLMTVVKNEKGMLGFDGRPLVLVDLITCTFYKQENNMMYLGLEPLRVFTVKLDDPDGKVIYTLDDPAYLETLKEARELAEAGVWSKNVLASKTEPKDNFYAGKIPYLRDHTEGVLEYYNKTMNTHPEWKPEMTDLQPDKIHEASSAARSGMAIHATAKNVERTLMMLNLFGTHKDYYDLTTYGIEGVHYQAVGDNKLKSLEQGTKMYVPKQNCPWGWERKDYMRFLEDTPDFLINLENDWIKNGVASTTPMVSFNFVDTNVKNEIAACSSLFTTRGYALITGAMKDPEAELNKLKGELSKAGIDKIQAELQKQITEYLNSLK